MVEKIIKDIFEVFNILLLNIFAWSAFIIGLKVRKSYETNVTLKEGVIRSKTSNRSQLGRMNFIRYTLEVKSDDGYLYHVETEAYRVMFYKINRRVRIIVPNIQERVLKRDENGEYYMGEDNRAALTIEKDNMVTVVLGFLACLLFLGVLLLSIVAAILDFMGKL